ncbi:Phage Tail Collar Domain protein [Roseovarius litorisediminis]|uniref:Phage Tail Collar Domain protein n=1 Tax=Roseovarius litorisediminis TaxID=1312363 RepID=A0A1Y5S4K0_9RHOB|nr:tail fiber protein [Roseovarius litorisediminis]SLN32456.1 Phage Tail Collar Domain protein [Roseovarius litorisediminis]
MKRKIAAIVLGAATALSSQTSTATAQDYWLGQIVMGGWNFCPRTTLPANGALLPISSNSALFSLLGCTYGGDCRTTFALPDLRGRIAMNNGTGPGLQPVALGQRGGRENFTPNISTLASHSHAISNTATAVANVGNGTPGEYAADEHLAANAQIYAPTGSPNKPLNANTVQVTVDSTASNAGQNQPVDIRNPYLGVQYCVVTQGIFPSRN